MTHLPYQAWCPHCVAGEAPNEAHRRQSAEESKMIEEGKSLRIGIDFWFMSDEEEERGQSPVIIMVDKQTKCHVSYPLESKSVSAWIVKRLCDDLETWGNLGGCDDQVRWRTINQVDQAVSGPYSGKEKQFHNTYHQESMNRWDLWRPKSSPPGINSRRSEVHRRYLLERDCEGTLLHCNGR